MIEEQYGWRVAQNCPNAIRILDTEDLHCLRHGRQNAVKENRSFIETDLISDVSKREIASILRCDITLMVSEFEIDLLVNYFKVPKEILFYMPIFADKKTEVPPFEERSDFVFIGNFLHDPNWDAVRYLATDIWPKIHALVPTAKMLIYGSYPSQKVMELHKPNQNFHVLGRAADATEVIQNSRVMLAPLRFGAGIKGKLIESMQCGTPSITTSIGAEGMCKDLKWNGFIENEPNLFAASAVQLYQNQQVWTTSQLNGYSILEAIFKKAHYVHLFESYFNSICAQLQTHRQANFMGLMLLHHTLSSTKYMSKWIEEKNKNNQ
jgi:glycosyltransferase involved in cell wall biosynthesis